MKWSNKIPGILIKLLTIVLVVLFLSACADKADDVSVGSVSTEDESCLSCDILLMMYDAVGQNIVRLHDQFSAASVPIMMVGFSIWLALRLLKFVSSVSETNAGEVWNEILKKAFICLICGFLASSSSMLMYVINFLVFPIYVAFLDLGLQILQIAMPDGSKEGADALSFSVFGKTIHVAGVTLECSLTGETVASASGFPQSIRNAMECMIKALTAYLTIGGDIAMKAMKQSGNLIAKMMGILLYVFFYLVKVGFVFYLVDAIFQMGIIILMLPLYILSYAFEPTREWTKKGLGHILASAGFMMCFSVITAMVLMAMISLISKNDNIFNPPDAQAHMSDISIGFLCLLLIGFLIYGSMGVSQQLTNALIGTSMDAKFQKNLKAAIQALGEGIFAGLSAVLSWGSSMAPYSNIKLVRNVGRVIKKAQAVRAKMQRLAGRK